MPCASFSEEKCSMDSGAATRAWSQVGALVPLVVLLLARYFT